MVEHTSGWHAPGVFVGLSDTLLKDSGVSTKDSIAFEMEFARMVSGVDHGQYAASCDYKGVSNVGTEVFDIALRRLWTGCAKGKFTVADLWAADADSGQLVYAIAVVPGRADVEAADRVLTSVRFQDTAVMDLS
jgi:hypothetical protein